MNCPQTSEDLATNGYRLHPEIHVWLPEQAAAFTYSDGDEVENRLMAILRKETDRRVFSPALAKHCTDWVTRYYFSPSRANLVRPLAASLRGSLLEIGAGCGAVTRYFGELGLDVTALEGSQRRARVAALRTEDLANVHVVSDHFDHFNSSKKYDVVTLIGVLEYARKYGQGDDPIQAMLERAASFLKPDGMLVVAIENQLGLKYFAGIPEDHVGKSMFGIQDSYTEKSVVTFGRYELTQRLHLAGFQQVELALPFPDYKMPISVVLPAGLEAVPPFNPAVFASENVMQDGQIGRLKIPHFSMENTWEVIGRNKLLADLSNSFLFVATLQQTTKKFPSDLLAQHYTTHLLPQYCKQVSFYQSEGALHVRREPLQQASTPQTGSDLKQIVQDEPFVDGVSLERFFQKKITVQGWTPNDVAEVMQRYVEILLKEAKIERQFATLETPLPEDFIDIIPRNIHVTETDYFIFDREWNTGKTVPLGYVLYRALLSLTNRVSRFAYPQEERLLNRRCFFENVFSALQLPVSENQLKEYGEREQRFIEKVTGHSKPYDFEKWSQSTFRRVASKQDVDWLQRAVESARQWQKRSWFTRAFHRWHAPKK